MSIALEDIPKILPLLPESERTVLLAELAKLEELKGREAAQLHFIDFVQKVWPQFIAGRHHYKVAEAFERVAKGELKRLIVCMPPRHSKSEFASYLLPAWYLGKFPDRKIIQCSHTAELAVGFGRKVRNLFEDADYQEVFPDVALASDSKAAGRWNTNKKGVYFAIGVGGAVTGMGADCAYFSCKVLTKRGIQPISKVKVGDYVYGYNHKTGSAQWAEVLAGSTQRKQNLVNVGGFICTPEHRVFTPTGYVRAEKAHSVAVHVMPDVVHQSPLGVFQCRAETGEDATRSAGLLFKSVQPYSYTPEDMRLREKEVPHRSRLQGVLPEGEEGRFDMHPVRRSFYPTHERVSEGYRAARGGVPGILLNRLLLGEPRGQSITAPALNGDVPNMQSSSTAREKVLLDGLLQHTQSEKYRIHRQVVYGEAQGEAAGWGELRLMWEGEATGSGASYRSRREEQHNGELHYPVRAMPHAISYSNRGACAADFADVLPGEGYWVVDIQTSTENFFVWGPDDVGAAPVLAHNCLIIDDAHSEQEAALAESNPDIYDKTYEWYTSGPRQRLQPGGAIIIVNTRWSKRDLTGRILQDAAANGSLGEWEVIEFPAILPSGKPLWPEFWSLEELERVKRDIPNSKWQAQYQQNPVSESAAIIKREWWQLWDSKTPPQCDFILQSWDTAFEKTQRADYSACTTWGVFYDDKNETGVAQANIILLNAIRDRVEFPELKKMALEEYRAWEPDSVIIEKRASGAPLLYELRAMGIPVQEFTPTRGNDKISRLNAVADIFASGRVWAPAARWAEEVIDEVAEFPAGSHDDLTDTVSMALLRFRKGGFVRAGLDEPDEVQYFKSNRNRGYY